MKSTFIILLVLITSCTSSKKNTIDSTTEDISTVSTAKIIFLNYNVAKNLDKTITASLVNKITSEGTIKGNNQKEHTNNPGDFRCIQLDRKLLPIDSLQIANPLIKDIEYVAPSGLLEKKQIELDSTAFSVRMQLNPRTKFISLQIINNPNTNLLTIEL